MTDEKILAAVDPEGPAPEDGELRQYYFLRKMQEFTAGRAKTLERKMTACVVTFGCQMNTEHGKRKAAKTAAFSYGVVFRDEGERKRGRISPSGRTGSEVRS